jgi:hypothetical protein
MSTLQDRPPPTALAWAIASALIAGVTGYFLGQASAIGVFSSPDSSKSAKSASKTKASSNLSASSSTSDFEQVDVDSDDDETGGSGKLADFKGNTEECKMVLVVRTDLGMTKGMCAYTWMIVPSCDLCTVAKSSITNCIVVQAR